MRDERGAALVEFAFVFMMMMMLSLGAFEWGMGFLDRLSVSQAVREAARVGAAAGDLTDADCLVLEAGAGALSAIGGNAVKEIWIYESDDTGTVGAKQRYRPSVSGDNPAFLRCGGGWFLLEDSWSSTSRDNEGETRDWIGVRVIIDHSWQTDFLWWNGTVEWQESSVFHLEPGIIF